MIGIFHLSGAWQSQKFWQPHNFVTRSLHGIAIHSLRSPVLNNLFFNNNYSSKSFPRNYLNFDTQFALFFFARFYNLRCSTNIPLFCYNINCFLWLLHSCTKACHSIKMASSIYSSQHVFLLTATQMARKKKCWRKEIRRDSIHSV